ncbi:MFS transporter [Sphaerotilus mobilis]|uniref:MFS transporter n=1 Tax=Sphaerotilus mobilis TaxID=47994 RepID=A0A4Q7LT56_9BURK|nr:MFS transporter [Sphaerotilus mobilis]RZS57824.1 MFS transporter [Sphaerotilus mobilis]
MSLNAPPPDAPLARHQILLALVIGQICLHAAMAGLRMALPLMLLRQGGLGWLGGEVAAGLLLGLFSMVPVVTAVRAGRWTDRRGYHRPVRSAVVIVVAAGLVAVPAAAWSLLWPEVGSLDGSPVATPVASQGGLGLVQLLLLGLAASLAGTGSNLGLIAIQRSAGRLASHGRDVASSGATDRDEATRSELKKVFSWLGIAPSLSNVIGPMLAGFLIDAIGFPGACAAMALLPLGTLLCAARVPVGLAPGSQTASTKASATAAASAGQRAVAPRQGVLALLALPGVGGILLANWFFSTAWDLHTFLIPLMGHQNGLSASAIGTVLGVFALAVTAIRLLVPLLAERLTERHVMSGAMLVIGAVFLVYPWATTLGTMVVCALVLGLAQGIVQPMILSTLHQLAPPDQQGEVIALRSAVINLSSAVLPLVFGLLGGALGPALLFRAMAVLLWVGAWLPQRLAPHRPSA